MSVDLLRDTVSFTTASSCSSLSKSASDSTSGYSLFYAEVKVLCVTPLPGHIDNSETYHALIVVLPKLSKSEVCALCYAKAAMEEVLGEELLEIRNHMLIHGLQYRDGVGWKVENLYTLELFKNVKVRK